ARLLGHLKVGFSPSRQKARMVLFVVAVVFVILALARPQWGMSREEARQRGLDIVVAIDTSNSMLAEDTPPNRLVRAKLAALDLMRKARTDRLGLIAFAGTAFLQCPLTLDDAAFSQSVNALDTKTISQGGTAIAEAIDEARKAFKNGTDNHRILVLFTDGEDNDGDALSAAEKAAKEGMMIFTIGIGTPEGEQLRIRDERNHVEPILDDQGKPVISHLNEELLQQIANVTKGFYLPLRGTKTMDTLYDRGLAPLPKSENSVKMFQRFQERFHWPLGIAILLLLLEMFLPDRSRRRSSSRSAAASAAKVAGLKETVAIVLLLALPLAVHGSPASALREYNEGKYQDALKDYNHLLEKKKDDPRLHFNAGAAAYQSKQLDTAVKEFNETLASPDLQLQQRAYYNLGNSLYRMGEQVPDADKKKEAWENSLKSYESALKLNQQDADARFNQDFVKQQLEELKKQQSQQSQSDKNSKQNQKQDKNKQDKQDQQNQDKKDQNQQQNDQSQSKDNQDKSKSDQNSQADNKVKEKSEEEKQQEKQKHEESQAQNQKPDSEKQRDAARGKESDPDKEKAEKEAQQEAAMMAAGQMTPRQAQQLLDSQKDDEKIFQLAPPNKQTSQRRAFKNW
ncbi:MAG: von Willebrand factor type, partial [Pedosphaera sp.]|nr:von Willebrand factor type [Pedosphaera sp.]